MVSSENSMLVTLVWLAVISQLSVKVWSKGIKCKVCSGVADSDCYRNTSSTKFDVECDTTYKESCVKIIEKYHGDDVDDINRVSRACARGYADGCEVTQSYLGYSITQCVCSDEDFCNRDNTIVITGPTTTTSSTTRSFGVVTPVLCVLVIFRQLI